MLLRELLEDTSTSAMDQLLYQTNFLTMLYSDKLPGIVTKMYSEGNHEDMWKVSKTVVAQQQGRWFTEHFLSNRSLRTTPAAGMKDALTVLSKDPRYVRHHSELKLLGGVVVNMDNLKRAQEGISYSGYVEMFAARLPPLLTAMAVDAPTEQSNKIKVAASRLKNAEQAFHKLWLDLHEEWDKEWGKETTKTPAKQKAPSMGQQLSQADLIINQVLGDLDKHVAHEIRMKLARTDNKLQTLQQELTKRGIKM